MGNSYIITLYTIILRRHSNFFLNFFHLKPEEHLHKAVQNMVYKEDFKYNYLFDFISVHLTQPYDYLSVMHYGESDFAINEGDIVLQTTDPAFQSRIGNRGDMTASDIEELNTVYG